MPDEPEARRAVVAAPDDVDRRPRQRRVPLVAVDERRDEHGASSRDSAIIPATNCEPRGDKPYGPSGSPLPACISGRVVVDVPDAHVEVARRAGPAVVGLGHERDAPAVEVGDLLGAVLEDHRPVGRLEDVVVADVDLVLAVGRLALAELDRDPRLGHLVAQQAVERLGLRRLEQLVVLVVVAERLGHRPAALGEALPRVLEHVVLELGAALDGEPIVRRPLDLALEDRPRADRDLLAGLAVGRVGEDERGLLEPGQDAQRCPTRAPRPSRRSPSPSS